MKPISFQVIDWSKIEATEHAGETGTAYWQTLQFDGLRVRIIEYSPGYLADHWCAKGHIVHCLEGEVENQLKTGEANLLKPGMTYIVTDDESQHRSYSPNGVKLLIIDGDFLESNAHCSTDGKVEEHTTFNFNPFLFFLT